MTSDSQYSVWESYKKFTAARIGLKRSGGSIGTSEMLKFRFDHAKAKDAVWAECDFTKMQDTLSAWLPTIILNSKISSREEYLLRPDLGRLLNEDSLSLLKSEVSPNSSYDIVFCVVDGLSPYAISKNTVDFLMELKDDEYWKGIKLAPIICIQNGRVAIGDQVAETIHAKMSIVLIGERPGLSSTDSIGIYITYNPTPGTTDERRNCISNVRPDGLNFEKAKQKLIYLAKEAFLQRITGVHLKDRMEENLIKVEIKEIK